LGTHSGNSFCGFLQAAAHLDLQGEFYAVDHWRGDPQASMYGEEVYRELEQYTEIRYPSARLLRMTFDQALSSFADNSVDLLHIDGLHTYEAVKHDFESWMPKMSDHGVVLLHDAAVRANDFGVLRFVEELAKKLRVFVFDHSFGLAVVQVGSEIPVAFDRLISGSPDSNGLDPRAYFEMIGTSLVRNFFIKKMDGNLRLLRATQAELVPLQTKVQKLQNDLSRLQAQSADVIDALETQVPRNHTEESARLILASGYFDPRQYAPEVGLDTSDPMALARHYLSKGELERVKPSGAFDPAFYSEQNPDVAESGVSLLVHFLQSGRLEGRLPKAPLGAGRKSADT
jgi:methyltransferase family protein